MINEKRLFAGFTTGLSQAVMFQPIDRALYLHVINNKPFLHKCNWLSLWQGLSNVMFSKVISYGAYFHMLDFYSDVAKNITNKHTSLISGILTGTTTACLLNPFCSVRYNSWKNEY